MRELTFLSALSASVKTVLAVLAVSAVSTAIWAATRDQKVEDATLADQVHRMVLRHDADRDSGDVGMMVPLRLLARLVVPCERYLRLCRFEVVDL